MLAEVQGTAQPSRRRSSVRGRAEQCERLLESFSVRLLLSSAIIVSLLPDEWIGSHDWWFFGFFAAELVARLFAMVAGDQESPPAGDPLDDTLSTVPRRSKNGLFLLLLLDVVALVSFLPLTWFPGSARWLRLFRLSRIVLLVGYWSPLVRDLWAIVSRRERARQIALMGLVVGTASFAGAVILHQLGAAAVDFDEDGRIDGHDRSFARLLWWAFRQLQDPGNMLVTPMAVEAVVVSLALTVFGLFLVSFLIGIGTDVMRELLELSRLRSPGFRGHTVIVNTGPSTRRLLTELIRYYRKLRPREVPRFSPQWWRERLSRSRPLGRARYIVVGADADPPEFLRRPEMSSIAYRQRGGDEEVFLARVDATSARRILVLADLSDPDPDVETVRTLFTIIERVKAMNEVGAAVRERLLIAEILDESNVAAARSAIATTPGVRGFVVPTEKLLGLFFAGIARRPGLAPVLEELLTSEGHELYTCFFDVPGLSFRRPELLALGGEGRAMMDRLAAHGFSGVTRRVVPLGLLRPPEPGADRDFVVRINPDGADHGRCVGILALADSFATIREYVRTLEHGAVDLPAASVDGFDVRRAPTTPLRRVLVCGFRPGTVHLLEALLSSTVGVEVLILVEDSARVRAVRAALASHGELVGCGILAGHNGTFRADDDGIEFVSVRDGGGAARIRVATGDWSASRDLVSLPQGFGSAATMDVVLFIADHAGKSDPRTTTALLKLDALLGDRVRVAGHEPSAALPAPRIIAEVADPRLAHRLDGRFRAAGMLNFRVYSIEELRAFFLFQSVVVPGFDAVYSELLGTWGQSLVRMVPTGGKTGPSSFAELAVLLRDRALILVAVELIELGRFAVHIAPDCGEPGDRFRLEDLVGLWIIGPDGEEGHSSVLSSAPVEDSGPLAVRRDAGVVVT